MHTTQHMPKEMHLAAITFIEYVQNVNIWSCSSSCFRPRPTVYVGSAFVYAINVLLHKYISDNFYLSEMTAWCGVSSAAQTSCL